MQPERADMNKDLGACPGSRADASSPQAVSTKGFDPARFEEQDPYEWAEVAELFEDAFRERFPKPSKIWAVDYVEWTDEYSNWQQRQSDFYEFLGAQAWLNAANALLDHRALWAVGDMEEGAFGRICWPMPDGGYVGGYVEGHARSGALSLAAAAMRGHAIATEAGTAATVEQGAVHEGAGLKGIAQGPSQ